MAQARTTTRGGEAREARIGRGARVRGRVRGEGDLVIEGRLEGDLSLRGDLTIAEGAEVASDTLEAHAVTVAGALEGDVTASGAVRLAPGARVRGNIRGTAIAIEDGARYSGRLDFEFDLPPELGGSSRTDARGRGPTRR
ncbi:MAG TPA: polymer-forming cytoskeletal protein [Polyangiaceae bacterium]|nr:polymer-forming cytoskeletal protein [Polyangiaceae bacterium]